MHSTRKSDPDQSILIAILFTTFITIISYILIALYFLATPLLSSNIPTNIQEKHSYGKAVFFILVNEFFQCFSFFGIQAVLVLYLVQVLLYNDDTATIIFHGFMMIFFFSPLLGAFVADVLLGRFKTIAYISVLYIIGNILISIGSVPDFLPMRPISILGIIVIAIGLGTTNPVYSSFGGDQFKPNQIKELGMFFSMWFMCIKLAKLAGTFLSPILRAEVHCFGESTCFLLAFGFPTILIIISLVIFLIGYPYYKTNPPSGNIMWDVIKCITHAIVQKFKKRNMGLKKQHWLDYADDKYDTQMITDVKSLFSVLTMFLPIPFYWALWGQQGSRWTLQATQMDNSVGDYTIKPDQMQVLNAILGIIIIPFLDYIIYPLLNKCNLLTRPLQRMTIGGLLVSFAFVVAGILQLSIEKSFTSFEIESDTNFDIIKDLPVQKLQVDAMNCSLHKVPNEYLGSKINQVIKCMYNNGTTLYNQHYEKYINSTEYKINNNFSLHNSSFPINRESNEVTYKYYSIMDNNETLIFQQHASASSSSLSILLQIPQYFLVTFGEMIFMITSIGFAYSQAPKTMKTVLPALLFVNDGIGNIIVMVITEINLFERQSYEFFFYAILLAIVMFIFAMLARNYKYKEHHDQ